MFMQLRSNISERNGRCGEITTSYHFFLWKEGACANEIVRRLFNVFGEKAVSQSTVYNWINHFRTGRQSLDDEPRPGRPATTITRENISNVEKHLLENRCITVSELAEITEIPPTCVHEIISQHLQMHKLTARWVPRLLTTDQKAKRASMSQELLDMSEELGESFWKRLITTDETWLPFYLPESKEQSKQWCRKGENPPLKARTVPSAGKIMITVFWDCQGIILIDYLDKGMTINSQYYSNLLSNDLRRALKNKRPGKLSSKPLLQQDNARPHTARLTCETLERMGWVTIPHPPYSPDLAPSDFHLFGALKKPLRGKHFASVEEMQTEINQWVRTTSKDFFENGLKSLTKRWQKCVQLRGDYIEKCTSDEC